MVQSLSNALGVNKAPIKRQRKYARLVKEKVGEEFVNHYMPDNERIIKHGEILWLPTDNGDGDIVGLSDDVVMSQAQSLKISASGWTTLSWSGLDINVPADGLMQLLMHISAGKMGTFSIKLTNANKNAIEYRFANSFYESGQKTIQLWNPSTDAHFVCGGSSNTRVSETGNFFDGSALSKIYLKWDNAFNGAAKPIYLDGLYSQTKMKPMICHTVDVSNTNVYRNFCPIFKEKGWSAGLRLWGGTFDSLCELSRTAWGDGFDIYNGSLTRLNPIKTEADTIQEMGVANNLIRWRGFPNPILYSSGGNSLPPKKYKQRVAKEYGIKWCKAPDHFYSVNIIGVNGLDAPLYTYVTGQRSYNRMVEQVAGLEYVGGFIMYFWHECVDFYEYGEAGQITGLGVEASRRGLSAGDEMTTTSSASGGSVWTESIQAIADYLEPKVKAGSIDVVGISELNLIMRGLM